MNTKKAAVIFAAAAILLSGCTRADDAGHDEKSNVVANTLDTASSEADTAASETDNAQEESGEKLISCKRVADRVMDQDYESVPTMEVTDETMISDVLGYDMSIADDYCIYMQMISAQLFELTVIRAADGQRDAVIDMLEKRKDYLINQAAVYPAQIEAAEATVVSNVGDYCFLICDPKASDLERYMVMAIKTPAAE